MKALSVGGTIAMFTVGGQIRVHGIGPVEHAMATWTSAIGGVLGWVVSTLLTLAFGVAAGALLVVAVHAIVGAVRRARSA
jgi:predicted DNA repair protein MutK